MNGNQSIHSVSSTVSTILTEYRYPPEECINARARVDRFETKHPSLFLKYFHLVSAVIDCLLSTILPNSVHLLRSSDEISRGLRRQKFKSLTSGEPTRKGSAAAA
jgi:hypothetical protein